MALKVKKLALDNFFLRPVEIWYKVPREMNEKYSTWCGLSDRQVIRKVSYIQHNLYGGDSARSVKNIRWLM